MLAPGPRRNETLSVLGPQPRHIVLQQLGIARDIGGDTDATAQYGFYDSQRKTFESGRQNQAMVLGQY